MLAYVTNFDLLLVKVFIYSMELFKQFFRDVINIILIILLIRLIQYFVHRLKFFKLIFKHCTTCYELFSIIVNVYLILV